MNNYDIFIKDKLTLNEVYLIIKEFMINNYDIKCCHDRTKVISNKEKEIIKYSLCYELNGRLMSIRVFYKNYNNCNINLNWFIIELDCDKYYEKHELSSYKSEMLCVYLERAKMFIHNVLNLKKDTSVKIIYGMGIKSKGF